MRLAFHTVAAITFVTKRDFCLPTPRDWMIVAFHIFFGTGVFDDVFVVFVGLAMVVHASAASHRIRWTVVDGANGRLRVAATRIYEKFLAAHDERQVDFQVGFSEPGKTR